LHRFHNISVGTKVEARKMFLYSAHDSTLLSLQHALNISNGLLVPYSACLIMELYKTENETTLKVSFTISFHNEAMHKLTNVKYICPASFGIFLSSSDRTSSFVSFNKSLSIRNKIKGLFYLNNALQLQILYKNETENANAYELFVPNCSVPCKLNQLIKLSAPTILDSVDDLNKVNMA
uniref:Lysosomal acid phosphatase n=1 Tax=Brugia timori TaxID=42155 RepID=A0A0R3Q455_9BILA